MTEKKFFTHKDKKIAYVDVGTGEVTDVLRQI